MKRFRVLLLCVSTLIYTGCLSPTPPPLPSAPPKSATMEPWWKELGDPAFNTIVEDALRESLSLQMAQYRVLQAYALVHTKKAATLPTLGASVSTTLQDELKGVESQKDTYAASLNASYEVDLFGKKEDALDAASASFQASFEALHISGISLVSELGNAWYTLGYKTQSLALLERQRDVAEKILHVTKLKHANGKNSITDVWQQEQFIASLGAQKIALEGDIEAQKRVINLLMGRSALNDMPQFAQAQLIALPPQPPTGIPATRLLNRPDVKQAYFSLQSANASLSEAIKNQYPSLNISLSLGSALSVTHFSDILDTILGSAVASLSGSIFDGGSKEALVKQAHFLSHERSLNYKNVMLQAFYEVQDALEKEKNLTLYLQQLGQRLSLARTIFERQGEKYLLGVVEYLSFLNAQQSLQELEQTHLSKQLELIKYRIALHRSLAGGFIPFDVTYHWSHYEN